MQDVEFWKAAYLTALRNRSILNDDTAKAVADKAVKDLKEFLHQRLIEYKGRPD